MSRFENELKVIPFAAWVIAVLAYGGLAGGLFYMMGQDMYPPPAPIRILFPVFIPLFIAIFIVLVGYVYGDARRRGMRHVMWTLLAIFIPNGIGIILYFVLREPMPVFCARCGGPAKPNFAFCPRCGESVQPACPQCGRAVETAWAACPFCGRKLAA